MADVYSLGAVLAFALTGMSPGDLPAAIAALPPAVGSVIGRATAADASARYPDAAAFAEALQHALGAARRQPCIDRGREPVQGPARLRGGRCGDFFGRARSSRAAARPFGRDRHSRPVRRGGGAERERQVERRVRRPPPRPPARRAARLRSVVRRLHDPGAPSVRGARSGAAPRRREPAGEPARSAHERPSRHPPGRPPRAARRPEPSCCSSSTSSRSCSRRPPRRPRPRSSTRWRPPSRTRRATCGWS